MKQDTFVYDPTTPEFQVDMHDIYRVLRDHYPLHHDVAHGFYALSRFADVWAAVHDPDAFSSVVAEAEALMPQMIYMDAPRHTDLRAIVSRAFTPKRIADIEGRVREITRALIEGFAAKGECDLVHDFAAPLPSTVIAELIGVPDEHVESFRSWTEQFVGITSTAVVPAQAGTQIPEAVVMSLRFRGDDSVCEAMSRIRYDKARQGPLRR